MLNGSDTDRELAPGDVLLAGLWMVPSMGGMPKTIELFRRALDAAVVSFTHGDLLDREGSAVEGAEHVRIAADWRGSAYSWASRSALCRADELVRNAGLISCHTLFRYHVHWVRRAARRLGVPYWVVPHGCLDPYVFSYRGWQKRLWMRLFGLRHLKDASAVIFSTKREKEKAARFLSRDNAHVIRWPAVNHSFGASERLESRHAWRQRLGAHDDERLLLYLGRFHSMKRPIETVEAFLAAAPQRTRLVLAGPAGDLDGREITRKAGGDRRIHAIPAVWGEEKESLLAACDGFVSLSLRENFGHAAAEAMKAGLPVVLSPGNDLVGELSSTDCGWLLRTDSQEEAIGAIRDFDLASGNELEAKARAGRCFADSELSFDRFREALRALAVDSLGRRRQ